MAVSVSGAAPAVTKRGMEADTIPPNGDIYTESGANPRAGVVAIRGRKFVYVGSRQDNGWREWVGRDTRIVDLHGRMVIPGITDSHASGIGRLELLYRRGSMDAKFVRDAGVS